MGLFFLPSKHGVVNGAGIRSLVLKNSRHDVGCVIEWTLRMREENDMVHEKVPLTSKQADGYVIPLGPINLVNVITDVGMVGCGAFDVAALDGFGYPAARVKSTTGGGIATLDDLLVGVVKDTNKAATKLGVQVGMSGREALDRM
jgi:uncharacterized protein YunC (DUF1805 family)